VAVQLKQERQIRISGRKVLSPHTSTLQHRVTYGRILSER
jgi:hypothetical protein